MNSSHDYTRCNELDYCVISENRRIQVDHLINEYVCVLKYWSSMVNSVAVMPLLLTPFFTSLLTKNI